MVKEKRKPLEGKLKRFIEERLVIEPEKAVRLAVWALGTVACHNLNIAGMFTWFGKPNDLVPTGLPAIPFGPPIAFRRRFPWEQQPEPTSEDKITEWALPAITSWMLIYHPEAIAKFIDALIPF